MPDLPENFPPVDDYSLSDDKPCDAALEGYEAVQASALYDLPETVGTTRRLINDPRDVTYSGHPSAIHTTSVVLPPGCNEVEARGIFQCGPNTGDAHAATIWVGVFLPGQGENGVFVWSDPTQRCETAPQSSPVSFEQAHRAPTVEVPEVDETKPRRAYVSLIVLSEVTDASREEFSFNQGPGSVTNGSNVYFSGMGTPSRNNAALIGEYRGAGASYNLADVLRPNPTTPQNDFVGMVEPGGGPIYGAGGGLVGLHWVKVEAVNFKMKTVDRIMPDAQSGGYQGGGQLRYDRGSGDNPRETNIVTGRHRHITASWNRGPQPNSDWVAPYHKWGYADNTEGAISWNTTLFKEHQSSELWIDFLVLGTVKHHLGSGDPIESPRSADLEELPSVGQDILFETFTTLNQSGAPTRNSLTEQVPFYPVSYNSLGVPVLHNVGSMYRTDPTFQQDLAPGWREGQLYVNEGHFEDMQVLFPVTMRLYDPDSADAPIRDGLPYRVTINVNAPPENNSRIVLLGATIYEGIDLNGGQ